MIIKYYFVAHFVLKQTKGKFPKKIHYGDYVKSICL